MPAYLFIDSLEPPPMSANQVKTKTCAHCTRVTEVAYRVRRDATKQWVFICYDCLDKVKPNNPHYVYGGTWKSSRH